MTSPTRPKDEPTHPTAPTVVSPYGGLSGFTRSGKIRLAPNDPDAQRLLALYPDRYEMGAGFEAGDDRIPPPLSPPPLSQPIDLSAGEYEDFFAIARQVLGQIGVLGRDPTDEEIVFFAKAGMNAESILEHYANAPEIIEKQPGVPYGLSLREYEQRTRELAQGFESVFRGQKAPDFPGPRTSKAERETSLFGGALRNRVSQQEFTGTLATFQQERGRAPTQAEFEERRNRPSYRARQTRIGEQREETRHLSGGVTSPRPARRK